MNGVLVLDKPLGPTSFDMVARVRRAAAERRVGHAGTLDPMASGVLVICLGEATKLVPFLMDADKLYRATLRLGVTTDTDDADVGARVLSQASPEALAALTEAQVRAALAEQVGVIQQRPPRYSALKVEGERLYDRARQGADDAEMEAQILAKQRPVVIHELCVEQVTLPEVRFTVRCGKGTYIRSIARDVGERLFVGAHLTSLRRLRVGRFRTEDATPLIEEPAPGSAHPRHRFDGPPRLFGLADALSHLPTISLPAEPAARLRNGQRAVLSEVSQLLQALPHPDAQAPSEGQAAAVLDESGALAVVLVWQAAGWTIARGFTAAAA